MYKGNRMIFVMKFMERENAVIKKYSNAKAIYVLQRNRRMSKKEYVFDFLVALFTPAPGIVEDADLLSDLGTYYLVVKEKQYLLVRAGKEEITEKDITNRYNSSKGNKFVVENNRFKKVKKIYG